MGWSRKRKVYQDFRVKIDTDKFVEKLMEIIENEINSDVDCDAECDEGYADGNAIYITGTYSCYGRTYYAPQTWESPAEYEEERPYVDYLPADILKKHAEALVGLLEVEYEEDYQEARWETDDDLGD